MAVVLDGMDISGQFDPVPSRPDYSYAKVSVSSGNHTLQSDEGLIAYVYGYGQNESFGYPTGAGLTNLNLNIRVFQADGSTIPVDSICHRTEVWFKPETEFDFTEFHWDFGDGTILVTHSPDSVPHTYAREGRYIVELSAFTGADGCISGAGQTSVKVVRVNNPKVRLTGPRSVCPNTTDVVYHVRDAQDYELQWFINGGIINFDSAGHQVIVDWNETNPDAWLKVIPEDRLGCTGDTVTKPVKIKVQLEPEEPFGPDSLCFDDSMIVSYNAFPIPGTTYHWKVLSGEVVSGQDCSLADIRFKAPGLHTIWFDQVSITDTVCGGTSDTMVVYLQRKPLSEAFIDTEKMAYEINEDIRFTLLADSLYHLVNWQFDKLGVLDSVSPGYQPMINFDCQGQYEISATALDTAGLCNISANATLAIKVTGPQVEMIRVSHELDIPDQLVVEWTAAAMKTYKKPYILYRDGVLRDTLIRGDIQYLDTGLTTGTRIYQYELVTNLDCPIKISSDRHKSIRISAEKPVDNTEMAEIAWNEYSGWKHGVDQYEIWMRVDGGSFERVGEQTGNRYTFESNDLGFDHCFKVKALELDGNQAYSWSNIACLTFIPQLYPYNIITPNGDGLNESFVIENIEYYPQAELTIFNRWGKKLYQTREYRNNWNGMKGSEVLPNSVYYYVLDINEERSPVKTINGTITILR